MKLNELIKVLTEAQEVCGDIDVRMECCMDVNVNDVCFVKHENCIYVTDDYNGVIDLFDDVDLALSVVNRDKVEVAVERIYHLYGMKDLMECGETGNEALSDMAGIFAEILQLLDCTVQSFYTTESVDGDGKYNVYLTVNGKELSGRRISAWYDFNQVVEEVKDILEEVGK